MTRNWWRSWPLLGVVALVATVTGARLAIDHLTREEPNYSKIEDGLFMGGYVAKPPPDVQAVLNLCETPDHYSVRAQKWEPIRDASPAPGIDWLREQVDFIDAQRRSERSVFVHCRNGVSRSGMVVVAYFMLKNTWSRDKALEFVRNKRPIVRPHPAFMSLLLDWEQVLDEARRRDESPRSE
jgi:protein-tyrosine phosphatase